MRKQASWTESVKWQGDFRYRYEDIQEEGRSDCNRNRIRARPSISAQPSDDIHVGFGLATGADDAVSAKQTLGGGGTPKNIRRALAYATWTGIEGVYATAGKHYNPYHRVQKSELIWDGDYRPEGLALGWANDMLFVNATYSFIEGDAG